MMMKRDATNFGLKRTGRRFGFPLALALAAVLSLAPGTARAADECGALNAGNSFTETCANQAYASGITYSAAGGSTLTVGGGAATTITSPVTGASWNSGITLNVASSATERRDLSLTVGSAGAVVISQGASPQTNAWYRNNGIQVMQRAGAGSTVTVDVRSGVTIGSSTARMANSGIRVGMDNAADTGAGAITLTTGAAIWAATSGIDVENSGPGASTVTNTGAIDATQQGIRVVDTGSAGALTIINSGALTAGWQGIFAQTSGTGKDAAGVNAGVSVTHSAGAIASSGNRGIQALVGASRQEGNTGHGDYVAPMNAGLAKVAVTGGSISAQNGAIQAINYEAGGVDVDVSPGVTLTSSAGSGIFAQIVDVGNAAGAIEVDNAGTITAAVTGIWVIQRGTANTGAVSVDNDGALRKTGSGAGYGIRVEQRGNGGVSIDNSGAIGAAAARHEYGIWLLNSGSGASTVANSGDITAETRGIQVQDSGSDGAITVTNSGDITAESAGIRALTTGKDASGDNYGVSVTHSGGDIDSENGRGIRAHVGSGRQETDTTHDDYVAPENEGDVEISVTGGSISAKWPAIEAFNHEAGSIDISVSSGVTLTSTGNVGIDARLTDAGNESGTITIDNAGRIDAASAGIFARIEAGAGDMTVTNSGAIEADTNAIFLLGASGHTGDIALTNSGALGAASARVFRGIFVAHDGPGGAVAVANSGAISATDFGIMAHVATGANGRGASVTHSGGAISVDSAAAAPVLNSEKHGIVARVGGWRQELDPDHENYVAPRGAGAVKIAVTGGSIASRGTAIEGANYEGGGVDISVSEGVMLSSTREHGIEADLRDVGNMDGTIKITQAGAISARGDGISATVTRNSPNAELDRPVIDIAWTGTYAAPEPQAEPESILFVAQAPGAVQAAQAVEAVETLRAGSAGIAARVMQWQAFMGVVSDGDDPGAFADAAAQAALFDDSADDVTKARAAAIVAQFRATLTAGTRGPIRDAGDVDSDGDDEYSDEEITAYLSEDAPARRTLLRNVLAATLTEREMAVFRALIAGDDVTAALDAVPGASDDYKRRVRALSGSRNDGDIRIAVNGGSIDSRGDGVRAFYGVEREGNGEISVTVAEGAKVTGAMAGIYVWGAGTDAEGIPKQSVTVHGTVTGGTDAAVHLSGGGRLTVARTGTLIAGSSGRAILVNDPGPAIIIIHGTVRGSAGAPAAVHLTGGGTVTIGVNGRVEANGAARAIQGDSGTTPTVVVVQAARATQTAVRQAIRDRVVGSVQGVESVRVAVVSEDGTISEPGDPIPVAADPDEAFDLSMVDLSSLPAGGACVLTTDQRRCDLYEALPSFLLAMNRMPTYAERASMPRGANGVWARVEGAKGEWTAEEAASPEEGKDLAYDYDIFGGRAGFDFAGESVRGSLSVHMLKGKAELKGAGEILVNGAGVGASAAWTLGDFYLDVSAQATWLDAEIDSSTSGRLEKEATGLAGTVGFEIGSRTPLMEGVFLIPRAGLTWASADLGAFTDSVDGAKVSVEDAKSLKARAGVAVEAPMGGGVLFGTIDVSQEFSDDPSVKVSDSKLETDVESTSLRVGAGGAFAITESVSVRASGYYETAGSGNSEYGGGVDMNVRF